MSDGTPVSGLCMYVPAWLTLVLKLHSITAWANQPLNAAMLHVLFASEFEEMVVSKFSIYFLRLMSGNHLVFWRRMVTGESWMDRATCH